MSGGFIHLVISLIASKKSRTLKTSPCGTTFSTVRGEEVEFCILTIKVLLLRKLWCIEGRLPRRPASKSLLQM